MLCARNLSFSILAAVLLAAPIQAQVVSDGVDVPQLKVFDDAVLQYMEAHNIPDAQLAVTWQGRLVLAHAYNNQSQNPVDIHSRFRIASVSKPLTSVLLHRLQQDGKLSLDDTIDQYLDLTPYGSRMGDERLKTVTVRNLLQHLGGFGSPDELGFDPVFTDAQVVNTLGVNYPVRKLDIQRFMNGRRLKHDPGMTYAYSNYGYLLAGLVIEAVSGLSYGAYADGLLTPIGIYDARLSRSEKHRMYPNEATFWSGLTAPSAMDGSGKLLPREYGGYNYENNFANGGWTLAALEYAQFLVNIRDPDATDAILNHASIEQMFALPDNWTGNYTLGDYYYASGWQARDYGNGNLNVWHDGALPGTRALAVSIQNGWNYVAVFNRRDEVSSSWLGEFDSAMSTAHNRVQQWPEHDLFAQSLPPVPEPVTAQTSGTWYDLTHDGEGFVVQLVNPTTAAAYWFTYDKSGSQRWYFGIGRLEGHRIIIESLYETAGGRFGPDFNPDDVKLTVVGSLVLSFYDNSRGKADYLLNGESGYQELTRLTQPFEGSDPMMAGDWRNGLWYDPTHNGEGYLVEVLPNGNILVFWFTYNKEGRPAWMIGLADATGLDPGVAVVLQRPEHGNFGVAFDPGKVQRYPNGEVTLTLGCSKASDASYSGGSADFPKVQLLLEKLAGYVSSPCP